MQQQGGSQYGAPPPPELSPPFYSGGAGHRQPRVVGIHGGVEHLHPPVAEAASPISIRSAPPGSLFEDFSTGGAAARSIHDEEVLGAGEEGERGGSGGGNRWPRQETLVLLKVRSEMDPAFRDATLKGPLWEDVSRKLAELGYTRSAKKCKEKFENVHKYYKRTKEGRAGRQDGKSYRFFSQLEALHSTATGASTTAGAAMPSNVKLVPPLTAEAAGLGCAAMVLPQATRAEQLPAAAPPVELSAQPTSQSAPELAAMAAGAGVSFSSNTSSSSSSESDGGEDTDDGCAGAMHDGGRKRKREGWLAGSGKTMAFFEGMMKQLMERQEAMQQRFLDTIEKREQDRMIREEAWKRQEMARLNREYELMAQERTMAANRDAAVISFLQKFAGGLKTPPPPPPPLSSAAIVSALASPEPSLEEAPPQAAQPENQTSHQSNEIVLHQTLPPLEPDAAAAAAELPEVITGGCLDMVSPSSLSSSRWPKAEVLALIKLRSGLEMRYMDAGPKGPLWEEISLGMKRMGYCRSTKRCKEKWENINKYFKKVKEGNKKRPEDAKTCPYYHELDALYRKKQQQDVPAAAQAVPAASAGTAELESSKIPSNARIGVGNGGSHEVGGGQIPRSNGIGLSPVFFGSAMGSGGGGGGGGGAAALKKPEDILKELMDQQHHGDDDEYEDDDEDDEEEEDGKLRYEIQFQRQGAAGAAAVPRGGSSAENAPAPSPASNAGSFLAMVQ